MTMKAELATAAMARMIDWAFLKQRFGAVYEDKPSRPPCRRA